MIALRCPETGETYPIDRTDFRGPTGLPLEVAYDFAVVSTDLFDGRLSSPKLADRSGVWRFRELIHPALAPEHLVSWPEGNTPLIPGRQIAAWAGCPELLVKHEGMNPTGSFKDRGMTVAVSQAKAVGARAVACASTGNTSAAVASYAAQAGMRAVILVPEGKTAIGKLGQALAYGARTVMIRGDFDAAMHLVQDASRDLGLYLLNSLNPFRIEGQKSIMFELMQQLGWEAPDWVVVPAGNLGNTSAFGKALVDAHELGLIDRIPRLLSVQAEGASPFFRSFQDEFRSITPMKAETIATAIRIGDPVSFRRAVDAIRSTNGAVSSVTDAEILSAKAVIDAAGVGCEPASAASVAGVKQAIERGLIRKTDRVVAILTGHVLKDPDTVIAFHRGDFGPSDLQNAPVVVDPTLEALAAAIA